MIRISIYSNGNHDCRISALLKDGCGHGRHHWDWLCNVIHSMGMEYPMGWITVCYTSRYYEWRKGNPVAMELVQLMFVVSLKANLELNILISEWQEDGKQVVREAREAIHIQINKQALNYNNWLLELSTHLHFSAQQLWGINHLFIVSNSNMSCQLSLHSFHFNVHHMSLLLAIFPTPYNMSLIVSACLQMNNNVHLSLN